MTQWSVRLDADGVDYDEGLDAALREHLARYSPAAGTAHLAGRPVPGRITVQLAVEASTLVQGADEARRRTLEALRAHRTDVRIVRLEIVPWEEFEAELEAAPPEIVGIAEIADILGGISRQRAHQIVKRDDFPRPVAALAGGSLWLGAPVRRWAATWERRVGRPAKTATG